MTSQVFFAMLFLVFLKPKIMTDTNNATISSSFDEKEKELIRKSLEKNKGNRKKAARDLNLSERTLYRKIKQFGFLDYDFT